MAVGVGVGVDVGVGVGVQVAVAVGEAATVARGGVGVRASGALQASARAKRAHRAKIDRRIDQLSPEGGVCQQGTGNRKTRPQNDRRARWSVLYCRCID